jgi:hypothetical protein
VWERALAATGKNYVSDYPFISNRMQVVSEVVYKADDICSSTYPNKLNVPCAIYTSPPYPYDEEDALFTTKLVPDNASTLASPELCIPPPFAA